MHPRHLIPTVAFVAVTLTAVLAATTHAQTGQRFGDVGRDHFAYDEIEWAAANNITRGYGDGLFKPGDPVTRAQAVTFLKRYHDNVATCWAHTLSGSGEGGGRLDGIEMAPGAYGVEAAFSNMRIDASTPRVVQLKVRGPGSRVGPVVVFEAGPFYAEEVAASAGRRFVVVDDPDEGEVNAGRVRVWFTDLHPEERWSVTFSEIC